MSTPTVKGALLQATAQYIQSECAPGASERAGTYLRRESGMGVILQSQWYPRPVLQELESIAAQTSLTPGGFSLKRLGGGYAAHLLGGTYGTLKKETPRSMAYALPLLYTCVFKDIRMQAWCEGEGSARFRLEGEGVRPADRETHFGIAEGALGLCGGTVSGVNAEAEAIGVFAFKVAWGAGGGSAQRVEVPIHSELDIIEAREKTRDIARAMGFGAVDVVATVTCASELARNIVSYAGEGTLLIEEALVEGKGRGLRLLARDRGPGIPNLEEILAGGHRSDKGLGMGLCAIQRLSDDFGVQTSTGEGTTVRAVKFLRRP